jgi:hypothetical protein
MLLPLLIALAAALVVTGFVVSADDRAALTPWRPMERATAWLALLFAVAAASWLLLVPTYAGVTTVSSSGGAAMTVQRSAQTLIGLNGVQVLPFLVGPIMLSALPLLRGTAHERRKRAAIAAVILVGFAVIGGFSIGLFYAPSALTLLAAATLGVFVERSA